MVYNGTMTIINEIHRPERRRGPRNEYWEKLLAVHPQGYEWTFPSQDEAVRIRSQLYQMCYRHGASVTTSIFERKDEWVLQAKLTELPPEEEGGTSPKTSDGGGG